MFNYTVRRILQLIPVLIGVTFITFIMFLAVPGNAVRLALGNHPDPVVEARITHQLGLDKPWLVRYGDYLWKAVQGDLGNSIKTGEPVTKIIGDRFTATLRLALAAIIFAIIIGVPAGIISATRQYSFADNFFMLLSLFGVSMPIFVLGLLLILLFIVTLGWIPGTGYGNGQIAYLILPSIALGTIPMAIISRMTRSAILEVLKSDYIRTARSKGIIESRVILKHAMKNSLIPVVTVIGNNFAALMAGAIITEKVFNWPGLGTAMINAIDQRDLPIIMGLVLFMAAIFVFINLVVDISYAFIDPRIRYK